MKSLTCLALLATAAAGSPVQKIFNLETSGAANSEHNGLYLSTYHTSPDTSDAVFVKNVQDAQSFYVNNNGTVTLEVTSSLQRAIELITINYASEFPLYPTLFLKFSIDSTSSACQNGVPSRSTSTAVPEPKASLSVALVYRDRVARASMAG